MTAIEIHGTCDPRFQSLQGAFAQNFEDGHELGASVAVSQDGEMVLGDGSYYNKTFISSIDTLGNFRWARAWMGQNSVDPGYALHIDESGFIYTAGSFSNVVDFDPGQSSDFRFSMGKTDGFVVKLTGEGLY